MPEHAALKCVWCIDGDDPAAVDDAHPVSVFGFGKDMRGQEHRHPVRPQTVDP